MSTIDDYVKLADQFQANGEFAHAARAYEDAVGLLNPSDMSDPQRLVVNMSATVKGMDGRPCAIADLEAPRDGGRSPVHDALVSTYSRKILEGKTYFVGFQCLRAGYSVVSYFTRKQLVLEGCCVATGRPRVFMIVPTIVNMEPECLAYRVPDDARVQLSYLLAHIGWANVELASQLYEENQILSDYGVPALRKAAQLLRWAIDLRATNAWAYARLGETHRRIANAWYRPSNLIKQTQSSKASSTPEISGEKQIQDYIYALLYYKHAISIAPDAPGAFWVHAHLGAAIVNVRAFVNVNKRQSPSLNALLNAWFDKTCSGDDLAYEFTKMAQRSLIKALRKCGNYYPWAENYYGGTFLFIAELTKKAPDTLYMQMLGMLNIVHSIYLQPSSIQDAFEPGDLYVSPFLAWGLFTFHLTEFDRAWQLTRNGMGRLFKFRFLPGLFELLGFQLLINISVEKRNSGQDPQPSDQWPPDLEPELAPDLMIAGVQIPESPILDKVALIRFIRDVTMKIGEPMIAPLESGDLNSRLEMSLGQAFFVFKRFRAILDDLSKKSTKPGDGYTPDLISTSVLVSECMTKVANLLWPFGQIDDHVRTSLIDLRYDSEHVNFTHDLFSAMMTGRPTYEMVEWLSNLFTHSTLTSYT